MAKNELPYILAAVLLMFVVSGLGFILSNNIEMVAQVFIFSIVVICVPVIARKAVAYSLDSSVEHRLWGVYQYGIKPDMHFKKEVPFGLIIPLIFSIISLGLVKIMTFITYETRALKHRAAKRFGYYSYTEMTDWHNGLIGAAGIISALLISLIAYFPGWEYLSKMAAYYAFWNMLPLWDLDGTQIFFGNKIVYSILGIITLIFTAYALTF
jgi:Zn-dependent protease